MQGTEAWQFMDGSKAVTVRPQGQVSRPTTASCACRAAAAGIGIAWLARLHHARPCDSRARLCGS